MEGESDWAYLRLARPLAAQVDLQEDRRLPLHHHRRLAKGESCPADLRRLIYEKRNTFLTSPITSSCVLTSYLVCRQKQSPQCQAAVESIGKSRYTQHSSQPKPRLELSSLNWTGESLRLAWFHYRSSICNSLCQQSLSRATLFLYKTTPMQCKAETFCYGSSNHKTMINNFLEKSNVTFVNSLSSLYFGSFYVLRHHSSGHCEENFMTLCSMMMA